ncbi:hypothetical protein [Rhizohabitans arisaemae]|uniref:hypothetical protein n=1 Tax=Rhizohabitans arisaemae TaxID=2720610 RepID=UPI0024B15BC5|nr:hypothetical protein [Rhizohabitans arisaemae]
MARRPLTVTMTASATSVAAVGGAFAVNQAINDGEWNWWWIIPTITLVAFSTAFTLLLTRLGDPTATAPGETTAPTPVSPPAPRSERPDRG